MNRLPPNVLEEVKRTLRTDPNSLGKYLGTDRQTYASKPNFNRGVLAAARSTRTRERNLQHYKALESNANQFQYEHRKAANSIFAPLYEYDPVYNTPHRRLKRPHIVNGYNARVLNDIITKHKWLRLKNNATRGKMANLIKLYSNYKQQLGVYEGWLDRRLAKTRYNRDTFWDRKKGVNLLEANNNL